MLKHANKLETALFSIGFVLCAISSIVERVFGESFATYLVSNGYLEATRLLDGRLPGMIDSTVFGIGLIILLQWFCLSGNRIYNPNNKIKPNS